MSLLSSIDFSTYGFPGLVVAALLGLIGWLVRDLRQARRELMAVANEHREQLLQVVERNTIALQRLTDTLLK